MAENVTIARPYAEAAFQLARGDQCAGALVRKHLTAWRPSPPIAQMVDCIGDPKPAAGAAGSQLFLDVAGSDSLPNSRTTSASWSTTSVCRCFPRSVTCYVALKNEQEGVQGGEHRLRLPAGRCHAERTWSLNLEARFKCQAQRDGQRRPRIDRWGARSPSGMKSSTPRSAASSRAMAAALQS
jgi:F-type H+-transporting ATPase subunit delta